ncbi:MAG: glycoside hydrolase family 127 protein [Planctomycetota bacterium]
MSALPIAFALLALVAPQDAPHGPRPLPLTEVRLLDGELRHSQDLLVRYLHEVDPERLLHDFRVNAGIASDAKPLGGWEAPDCELRGHFTGHYLSACAEAFEATGDDELRARAVAMVAALAECQDKLGKGYLSAFPESFFDRLERGERVWAPWYTLHKVLQGLIDVHLRCHDARALEVATRFADWVDARTARLDEAAMQKTLDTEFGGMPDALAALHAITKEPRHLALASRFRHRRVIDPLATDGDPLRGLHANTQIPKLLAEARLFELTGDDAHRRAATRFFDLVTEGRCYPTGGTSSYEYWRRAPGELAADLGPETAENCVTHNLRKLALRLFAQTGDWKYADYAERALWNGILGTHHPDDAGSIMYYVPLLPGLFRHYSPAEHSFVCCSGTGIESFATLCDGVWWEDDARVWVTGFVPSRATFAGKHAEFELRTRFPDEQQVTIVANSDCDVTVRVRVPSWARQGEGTGYIDLRGPWTKGKEVTLTLPMALHLQALPDAPQQVAVMYGPLLLAARLGTAGMNADMIDGRGQDAYRMATQGAPVAVPVFAADPQAAPDAWLERIPGDAPRYRSRQGVGHPRDLEFAPFYRVHGERYAAFVTLGKGVATGEASASRGDVVDAVRCGDPQSQRAHDHQSWRGTPETLEGGVIALRSPSFLRFDLRCDPQAAQRVRLEFASADAEAAYQIELDGLPAAHGTVPAGQDATTVTVEHTLDLALTRGKEVVALKLLPGRGAHATPRWVSAAMLRDAAKPSEPPKQGQGSGIVPVDFSKVQVDDAFWSPRIAQSHDHTIPHAFEKCDARLRNFERAAGMRDGGFEGAYPFDDSDVYKVIEGAAYHLALHPDPALDARLDSIIATLAKAQEPDGYLYTARQLHCDRLKSWFGDERWSNLGQSHELYNAGHLIEAAVAHFQATGKRSLLDVGIKLADLIDRDFGPKARHTPPGHPELEIALMSLSRATGEKRYLDLARFFVEQRGHTEGRAGYGEYAQDHAPVLEAEHAVGHAVRAAYLYTAMADIAALDGDPRFVTAVDRLWNDVVGSKLYVTGGIGATGAGEAFGAAYELPNASAYCETCAAIANALWNHRMFLLHGDARYVDVLERSIYNNVLSGIGLDGTHFFYPNVLQSFGGADRAAWFGCACCPSNLSRFVPSIARFVAATRGDDDLFVNLYVGGRMRVTLGGREIGVETTTRYPLDGEISLRVSAARPQRFRLRLRIPGWARETPVPSALYSFIDGPSAPVTLAVDGEPVAVTLDDGYALLEREWKDGDTIALHLPMPVRKLRARDEVEADRGKLALQRGPLMYCVEGVDLRGGDDFVPALMVGPQALIDAHFDERVLGGTVVLDGTAALVSRDGRQASITGSRAFRAIPYALWANRGRSPMTVWLAAEVGAAQPAPGPTLAHRSKASASFNGGLVGALSDQFDIADAADKSRPFFHTWPHKGGVEWVQYEFPKPASVQGCEVFWLRDIPHGECELPVSWRVLYREGGEWKPVAVQGDYPVTLDRFDHATWSPVTTDALRLEITQHDKLSTGIHEWRIIEGSR